MNWQKTFQYAAMALVIFAADAILKAYVHLCIPVMHTASPVYPYDGIGVFEDWCGIDFAITHVMNRGAAWGIFAAFQDYLLYARILIIGGLLAAIFFVKSNPFRKGCLTLIATGAIGNVVDYFVYGHVVDMFYFKFGNYSYPVFNVADSAIFCGIALLLIKSCLSKRKKSRRTSKA